MFLATTLTMALLVASPQNEQTDTSNPAQPELSQREAGADQALPRRAGALGVLLDPQAVGKLMVREVVPGLPADRAGVKADDVLVAIAGQRLPARELLGEAMRSLRGGQTVPLEVKRGDATITLQLTLSDARESVEGSTLRYASVTHPDGYRLRTIITEPTASTRAKDGKLPAFLYVQGIYCDTIDRPNAPDAVDTRIIHAMAKAGFITMRVDKPGIGDSEGPNCSEIDFTTELQGFQAALRELVSLPNVDPERIYVFGHSMGGVIAPYLSAETPVRGMMVYGTLARTWFEYQLENTRRQSELEGVSPAEVSARVQAEARTSAMILIEKKTLGDVWERWPELRVPTQGVMYDETHMSTRHMRFFHELQDLNLADAWAKSRGAVLSIWGEFDWVTSKDDHQRIVDIVNERQAGAGSLLVMPRADHAFTKHRTIFASRTMMGQGEWDADLITRMLEWIDALESGTRASWQEPVETEADIEAAVRDALERLELETNLPAWSKLAIEPYSGKQDDISFVNPSLGFYGNGAGKIFRTTDGGESWQKVFDQPGTFVRCLTFVDERHGVMGNIGPGYFPGVTDATPIYRTEDGGATWTPVTTIEGAPVVGLCAFTVVDVPFVNAGNFDRRPRIIGVGRVGGPAAYIWSDDLGKTWKQGKLPEIATMAFDVHFLDESRGFIASATHADVAQSNGLILATDDGGTTWREVYRSERPFEITWKFSFPSNDTGYCTLQSYNPDPAKTARFVLKTADGGKTWWEVPLVSDHAVRPFGIAFIDEERGWVGAMPHGFQTVDGGLTWTRAEFGNAVNKIRVVPTEDGFVAYAIGVDVHKTRVGESDRALDAEGSEASR
jgi:photosystem II stability/assembly factor-like uncharacterized protein/pimeloyl-ACP methyl ester carboxylesterase